MAWNNRGKVALCAAVLACSGSVAQAAGWTYVDMRTFTEDATGLMWDQCNAHTRTEFCVTGSIESFDSFKKLSPDEALGWATTSNTNRHYGYSDWCVPNFSTLKNLYANTQNSFPGYPGIGWLMTSTPAPVGAYQVLMDRTAYGNSSEFVRLVRSTVYFGPNAVCDVRVGAAIPTLGATTSNLVVSPTNGGQGTGYWLGVTDRKRVPTAAEVRAGLDYDYRDGGGALGGWAGVPAGSVTTNIPVPRFYATLPVRIDIHHMYFVMEDSQGNLSSVVGPISNSSLLIQTINFDTPSDTLEGTDVVLRATASSGKTVNLTSDTPAVCSVNAGIATPLQSGVCTVSARVPNDGIYSAAPRVSKSFTFLPKTAQNISFGAAPALQVGVASATLSATGGASGNAVTFSTSSATCSLSGANNSVVRGVAVGSCLVQADQAGDANYSAASPVTQTIAVGKGSQSIGFGTTPTLQVGGATATLSATGGATGNPVTFSTSSAACSLSGANNSVVKALVAGSCTVQADQTGDANYNAASPVTQTIAVGKGSQSIGFGAVPALQAGATRTLGATGGGSVSPVTFSTSSAACSLSGVNNTVVKGVAAGSCVVQASQAGDVNYNAAPPVTQTITVGKGSQSISFGAVAALQVGATGTLGATGGGSVSAVTFSTSSAACSLSGANNSVVRGVAVGSCLVQADQAGDANYNAASPVTQTIAVGKGSQSIGFGTTPTLQVGGATAMLSATGGATGNPVTFSTSSAACSLSGANNSVVKPLVAGSCTVQADQAGDANYNAASPATKTVLVAPATPGSPGYTGSTPAIAATHFSPAVAAGTAQVAISGGTDAGCGFASAQFAAPLGISGALPVGYQAAAAGFQFSSSYCGTAATVQIAITYPQALPTNMVLYKWGPAAVGAAPSWFAYPGVTISADRKTLRYSITDGGVGDANPADGYISDPVFVAVPNAPPVSVPGLGVWALLMLSSGLLLLGLRQSRASA